MAQTAGTDFSGNAMSPGGAPSQFVDNAMSGGGSPASVIGGPNDPVTQAQTQGLYASTVTPPSSPTGTQSGPQGGNWGSNLSSIITTLFGSQSPRGSSLGNVAAQSGAPASAGWPMAGGPAGAGGRDPFGNTYTIEPGYQGSPTHPLPAYSPSAAAATAPVAAPAPAPQPEPQQPAAGTGGDGKITPADPTPEKATEPDTPEQPKTAVPQPGLPTGTVEAATTPHTPITTSTINPAGEPIPPSTLQTAQAYMDPATASQASTARTPPTAANTAISYMDPLGTGQVYPSAGPASVPALPEPAAEPRPEYPIPGRMGGPTPEAGLRPTGQAGDVLTTSPEGVTRALPPEGTAAGPAPVSPQSSTGPGNTPTGGWKADPDSAIGRLMRGDYSGAFSEAMRALTGQLGTPNEQNMIGKGAPPPPPTPIATENLQRLPGRGDIERQRIAPDQTFQPPVSVPGTFGSTQLARGDLGSRQPMDPLTAAAAGGAGGLVPGTGRPAAPQAQPGVQATPAAPSGTARAAPQTVQERTQWRAAYENWRKQNKLFDTPVNQERFNTEQGYPPGSSSAAPTAPAPAPAPGQAGAATRQPGGTVPARTAPGTDMLNAIRARQGLPPLPSGSRIGAPQQFTNKQPGVFSSDTELSDKLDAMRAEMNKIKDKPSTRIEDRRNETEFQGPVQGRPMPQFNPNDPFARQLLGRDPRNLRPEVLRDMNTTPVPGELNEAGLWEQEMTNYYGPNWRARFGPGPVPPTPAQQVNERFPR
jgi:hypothetical protein